jgi:hypothetical protein
MSVYAALSSANPAWAWRGVHGLGIDAVWPAAWQCLEPAVALTDGRFDEESTREHIRNGSMQLWMSGPLNSPDKMAVTTELVMYPRQKWCRVVFAGGKGLPHAFGFLGIIEAWAKSQDCVGVEGIGRPEWRRPLGRVGYAETAREYRRKFA